jgi:hypothetical protein
MHGQVKRGQRLSLADSSRNKVYGNLAACLLFRGTSHMERETDRRLVMCYEYSV